MMTKDEWESMAGSAGWAKFKQYMVDCREGLKEGMARGRVRAEELPAVVIECQLLHKHSEINLEQINRFYGAETSDED